MASRRKLARKVSLDEARAPSARDLLIDQVQKGSISPSQAEAEAERQGVGPLETKADPALFDPMAETWWTLPMTIAWIVWRTPAAVREQWDKYRKGGWEWVPLGMKGQANATSTFYRFDLRRPPPANCALLALAAAPDGAIAAAHQFCSVGQAKTRLWGALQEAALVAEAIELESERTIAISSGEWTNLSIYQERDRDILKSDGLSPTGFRGVRLRSNAVRDAWPATVPPIERLPETVPPIGSGYMPLYCAVQWIATQGGKIDVGFSDTAIWDDAYAQLITRIASYEVAVFGRSNSGVTERLDGAFFIGLHVDHPFQADRWDLWLGTDLYLRSVPYIDDRSWRHDSDDRLRTRWETKWSRLQAPAADIAKFWSFAFVQEIDPGPLMTGGPGKPTTISYVLAQHERRCAENIAHDSVRREADHLEGWFHDVYPGWPCSKRKTIENRIRENHRRWRSGPRK